MRILFWRKTWKERQEADQQKRDQDAHKLLAEMRSRLERMQHIVSSLRRNPDDEDHAKETRDFLLSDLATFGGELTEYFDLNSQHRYW